MWLQAKINNVFYLNKLDALKASQTLPQTAMMAPAGGMDWQAKRLEGKIFTVRFIDSAGQIHLEETGIALLPGVDIFEIVK